MRARMSTKKNRSRIDPSVTAAAVQHSESRERGLRARVLVIGERTRCYQEG